MPALSIFNIHDSYLGAGSLYAIKDNCTAEISAKIHQMGPLLNDRAAAFAFIPPDLAFDLGIGTHESSDRHHDRFSCFFYDSLHVLNDFEVAKHVAHARNDTVLFKEMCEIDGICYRSS